MTGINLTGKGHVPYCEPCSYVGKPQPRVWKALVMVNQHRESATHRRNARKR